MGLFRNERTNEHGFLILKIFSCGLAHFDGRLPFGWLPSCPAVHVRRGLVVIGRREPFGRVGPASGRCSTLGARELRRARLRSRYPCSRSDPRPATGRFIAVAVKRRFRPWARASGFLCCLPMRRNWLPTNVAIRSCAARAARGGPESLSRAPVRRRPKGAFGLGSRGDRSVFWMRNVQRAWGLY